MWIVVAGFLSAETRRAEFDVDRAVARQKLCVHKGAVPVCDNDPGRAFVVSRRR